MISRYYIGQLGTRYQHGYLTWVSFHLIRNCILSKVLVFEFCTVVVDGTFIYNFTWCGGQWNLSWSLPDLSYTFVAIFKGFPPKWSYLVSFIFSTFELLTFDGLSDNSLVSWDMRSQTPSSYIIPLCLICCSCTWSGGERVVWTVNTGDWSDRWVDTQADVNVDYFQTNVLSSIKIIM